MFKRFLNGTLNSEAAGGEDDELDGVCGVDDDDVASPQTSEASSDDETESEDVDTAIEALGGDPECPNFRGNYFCRLCPERVLISQSDLEKHLVSKAHKKREKQWHTDEQEKARIREQFNRRILHTETSAPETTEGGDKAKQGALKTKRKRKIDKLTPQQIKKRKEKFQRKKARRTQRRQQQQNT